MYFALSKPSRNGKMPGATGKEIWKITIRKGCGVGILNSRSDEACEGA
jgi:hypothetical protein